MTQRARKASQPNPPPRDAGRRTGPSTRGQTSVPGATEFIPIVSPHSFLRFRPLIVLIPGFRVSKQPYKIPFCPSHSRGTTTARPPTTWAESASPAPSDQTRALRGRHDERVELPGRSHDDLADDLRDLRGVCCLRRATKREHVAVGTMNAWSSKGGTTTTSPTSCAICASCVVRRPRRATSASCIARAERAHHAQHARRGHGATCIIIVL
jgi:hypothetical protein